MEIQDRKGILRFFSYRKVALVLITTVLVGGTLWFLNSETASESFSRLSAGSYDTQKNLISADTDRDGLKDWEEALWGTDPNIADSDGDGTNDGAEVKVGRNPAVAGPNDRLPEQVVPKLPPYEFQFDDQVDETVTGQIGINLVGNYLQAKSLEEYDQRKDSIVFDIANEVARNGRIKTYGPEDLNFVDNPTEEGFREYINNVGDILASIENSRFGEEYAIYGKTIASENLSNLSELTRVARDYDKLADELRRLEAPKNVAPLALGITNSLYIMSQGLMGIARANSDPILAPIYIEHHRNGDSLGTLTVNTIRAYIEDSGMVFEIDEGGAFFL